MYALYVLHTRDRGTPPILARPLQTAYISTPALRAHHLTHHPHVVLAEHREVRWLPSNKLSRDQKRILKKAKCTPPPRDARTLLPSPSLLRPRARDGERRVPFLP